MENVPTIGRLGQEKAFEIWGLGWEIIPQFGDIDRKYDQYLKNRMCEKF